VRVLFQLISWNGDEDYSDTAVSVAKDGSKANEAPVVMNDDVIVKGAVKDFEPNHIAVSVDETQFTVAWTTHSITIGEIVMEHDTNGIWGDEAQEVFKVQRGAGHTHTITVDGLKQDTRYLFNIKSGETLWLDKGMPFMVTTLPELKDVVSYEITGKVVAPNSGNEGILVYAYISIGNEVSNLLTTSTDKSGNFNIDIGRTIGPDGKVFTTTYEGVSVFFRFEGGRAGSYPENSRDWHVMVLDGASKGPAEDMGTFILENTAPGPIHVPVDMSISTSTIVEASVTDTGAKLSWTTDAVEEGYVIYGESSGSLPNTTYDDRGGALFTDDTHHVTLTGLKPATTYYYRLWNDDTGFSPVYNFNTQPIAPSAPHTVYGHVNTIGGAGNAVGTLVYIYIDVGGAVSELISTYTDASGNFAVSLAECRKVSDGSPYASYLGGTLYVRYQGAGDGVNPLSGYTSIAPISASPMNLGSYNLLDPFGSWSGIPWYVDAGGDMAANDNINIVSMRAAMDASTFYTYLNITGAGTLFGDAGPDGDTYRVLIDTDVDSSTGYYFDGDVIGTSPVGYHIDGIGADYLIEVFGAGGAMESAKLYSYGGADQYSWDGFSEVSDALASVNVDTLLVQVPIADIGSPTKVAVYVTSVDGDTTRNEDYGDYKIFDDATIGVLEIIQTDPTGSGAGTEITNPAIDYVMLDLSLIAHGRDLNLDSLTIEKFKYSTAPDAFIDKVELVDGGAPIGSGVFVGGQITFSGLGILLTAETPYALTVEISVAAPLPAPSAVSLNLIGVGLVEPNANASLTTEGIGNRYINASNGAVDGIFDEWIVFQADSAVDVTTPNVNIIRFQAGKISSSKLSAKNYIPPYVVFGYVYQIDGITPMGAGINVYIQDTNTMEGLMAVTDGW